MYSPRELPWPDTRGKIPPLRISNTNLLTLCRILVIPEVLWPAAVFARSSPNARRRNGLDRWRGKEVMEID